MENNYIVFLGTGFLAVGGLDILHTLSYKGMGVFHGYGANLSTQLWISARYVESLTLFIAPLVMNKKFKTIFKTRFKIKFNTIVLYIYLFFFIIILLSIFYWEIFPDCFVDGAGSTLFKKFSEYIISLILLGSLYFLFQNQDDFEPKIFRLLCIAIILTVFSELAFTFYITLYDFSNFVGHVLKFIAFYLIYKAIIVTGFQFPRNLMLRERKEMEKHGKLIANISDVIVIIDKKGMITYKSSNITEQFGWKYEDIIGQNSLFTVHPDDRERIRKEFIEIFNNKDARTTVEYKLLCKDGSFKPIEMTAVNMLNDPVINGILVNFKDITSRLQVNEKLRKSEKKFRMIFNASPDAINLNNLDDGVYIDINDGFTKITGYTKKDVIGKSAIELKIWNNIKDRERFFLLLKKQNGVIDNMEADFKCKNGQIITALLSARLLNIDNKDVLLFINRDISEKKHIEEELKESEERFRQIYEHIAVGIAKVSLEFRIEHANKAYCNMLGWQEDDLIGKHLSDITAPEIWEENLQKQLQLSRGEINHYQMEKKFIHRNGSTVYGILDASLIRNSKGEPLYALGCVLDVTHIKRSEGELKKIEAQLQQSQKMEAIGVLAGGIAHDFNNILFPIIGYTEMILADLPQDSPFQKGLNRIYTGALRARDLVTQILTFAREDTCELKPIKIQFIIKEALKLLRATIPATIDIKYDIQTDCSPVQADTTKIHQIIMNLTTNAYHAMADTGGQIIINFKEMEISKFDLRENNANNLINFDIKPGSYACLSIADTGIGMNKDLVDKIFDPFFTTKEKGKGTGMGLSVVYGIVKSMKGMIHVYSEPGRGSEFHVYLPVVKPCYGKEEIVDKESIIGGSENILLVDDEQTIAVMEEQMLNRLGYKVTSSTDSVEALEVFRSNPHQFDLVITDLEMPNMPGDRFACEIIKIRTDIPILLCTGFSETMSKEKAASLGIKEFILKPVLMKNLAQKIREVLDKK